MAPSAPKQFYLTVYNFASAVAWLVVLGRTASAYTSFGQSHVPRTVEVFSRWTQTAAVLELVHSATGIVRSPFITSAIQIASRIILTWGVVYPFPPLASLSVAYTTMLLSWSTTEVIRYSYFSLQAFYAFAAAVSGKPDDAYSVSAALTKIRYSTFLVLYPTGISSEAWMLWLASQTPMAAKVHPLLPYVYYAILSTYVPGSYIMYTHMLAQRKKVFRKLKAAESHSK